jgi:hypothetical protein
MANPATDEQAEPLLLSIKRAAEILGLSEWQVRQHFPITKIGPRSYVASKTLREYVQDGQSA